jgi:hypothetical protein
MQKQSSLLMLVAGAVGMALVFWFFTRSTVTQTDVYRAARTAYGDGKPELSGIWQALGSAHWDLEGHAARQGPVAQLGGAFSVAPGLSVVEGGKIPYQPWAAEKKQQNAANWLTLDPEIKCYQPGVPRATYMPYPFQIVQTPTHILITHEYASASRVINMVPVDPSPVDTWMGHSVGRWEGDTLVVDVSSFNDQTWFDRAGNFHSGVGLRVTERYTPISRDALMYEATVEDPKVFTRPWKIALPLYRRLEPNAQLLEYKCVEFAEELMYGDLRRRKTN